jgi:hypothetical protein
MLNYKKIIKYLIIILIIILLFYNLNYNLNYNIINKIYENFNNNEYNIPKIIWTYWDNEELPKLISQIIDNNNKILHDWKINVLNDKNINTYLDKTNFNNKYDSLSVTHKSDYIRLKLLEKYGGVWIDASIIINSQNEFNKLLSDSINIKSELTAFTLYDKDETHLYHQYIESWFLMVPEKSNIIKLWLTEFENSINIGFEEYNKNIINNNKNIKIDPKIYNINYNNSYLIIYTTLQVVLQSKIPHDTIILLLKSEDTMYKLLSTCNFNADCVKSKFKNKNDTKQIPFIKLRGDDRPNLDLDNYFT